MRFPRTISLSSTFLLALAVMAGLTVVAVGYGWLSAEYRRFAAESVAIREQFVGEREAVVRSEVEKVLDYIAYRHSKTQEVLQASLRSRVNEAHAIAVHLVEVEHGRRSRPELEHLVTEALRPIRFNNGRGYFFMVSMAGVEKLYPVAPEFENTNLLGLQDAKGNFVIRDEISLLRKEPEGFVFDHWRKPGGSEQMIYPKITFVKRFEPFDWYLGTGEYLDDFERDLQDELLDRISSIRFGAEGYVFVNTFAGDALVKDGQRVVPPVNIWDLADPHGVRVIQEERRVCNRGEGGFIHYTWNRLTRAEPAPKISFVKGYQPWQWMVGAGVYLDEIEPVIAARRLALGHAVRTRLMDIAATLVVLGLLVALAASVFFRRTRASFEAFSRFFARAATESAAIDETQVHFSEFVGLARSANAMVEARRLAQVDARNLQEQLQRSRKMEALGLLTGGVAHDLNNILSGLVMLPDLMLMELPAEAPARRRALAIKQAGQRAAAVVADLLAASRGGRGTLEVLNLNEVVQRYLETPEFQALAAAHPEIVVRADLHAEVLNIRCSPSQLGKTVMNLVTNAMEAVRGSGQVTIASENRCLEQPHAGYETIPAGEYVVLRVADTGSGIAAEDLGRVFEPFFTKKILGRTGTGLGLTVVWHTLKGNNGFIDVRSDETGTVFDLFFPVCRDKVAEAAAPIPLAELQGHGERILVVDDEATQREIAAELLTRLGYCVEVAASGEEAVAMARQERFDVVVLDMIMEPGMGGRETYAAILRQRPGQRAIIASGYAETEDIRLTLEMGAGVAVLKPYTIESFGRAVRDELRRAGQAPGSGTSAEALDPAKS